MLRRNASTFDADCIFVPEDFDIPLSYEWPGGKLVPLSESHAAEDFAAVSASAARIRHVFGPANEWPAAGMTEVENTQDILRHEKEFASRLAFTYVISDPDSGAYVGCLYIKRIKSREETDFRKREFNAQAFFWLSEYSYTELRDVETYRRLNTWLTTAWPFQCLAWPGRNISWSDWKISENSEQMAQALGRRHRLPMAHTGPT